MKRILLILVFLSTTYAQSQEKFFEEEVKKIANKIELITKQEKDSLKKKVILINKRLEDKEITKEKAVKLKKTVAQIHAKNIENRVSEQEFKLQQLVQDKTNGRIASLEDERPNATFKVGGKTFGFYLGNKKRKKKKRNKRTTSQFVLAFGVNNVLVNNDIGSLNDSEYKFWQSHFYELGFTYKTRISKEPSKTYFKYGISFLWNNLRAKNNQYHTISSDRINLETFTESLTESRLRHVQMIFPMHLEFDFSENKKYDDGFIKDRTHKSVRFGFGGFWGFKLGTRQYLEFVNSSGVKIEEVQKNGFTTNTLNYGLSTYFAYKGCGLYMKYDLNSLFKETDTRNISLGVRLDLN